MSGSKSKRKGSSWERDIARFLTELYGESFIRAPHSGAYIGGSNAHRKILLDDGQVRSFKGDIVPPSSWTRFNAEAKSYRDFPFHQLFETSPVKILDQWIEQCLAVADTDDFNIIFMKFNRKGAYVAVQLTAQAQSKLCLSNHIIYTNTKHGPWAFLSHDNFWNHNFSTVKELSSSPESSL